MYAMNTSYNRYKEQGVLTANPVELIVMLYDGCIKNLRIAAAAIDEKNLDLANQRLIKVQELIIELINSLDLSYPIAKDLLSLYTFMIDQIVLCNRDKDTEPIQGVLELLLSLRQAWNDISKEGRGVQVLIEE